MGATRGLEQVNMDPNAKQEIQAWLEGSYDEQTKKEVLELLQKNPKEAESAFYKRLEFGTGGLRGLMGVGSNRVNKHTICAATQGLANYLKKEFKSRETLSVLIGYDNRRQSQEFAYESARVLAGNGIKAYCFRELRPTPLISFSCRLKDCQAAIMITASHNPPEYNGYKVYWEDGAQILPPHDRGIINEIEKVTDPTQVLKAEADHPLIEDPMDECDARYLESVWGLQNMGHRNREHGKDLSIVFSPLHGTGGTLVPTLLNDWGFSKVQVVPEQAEPDPNFPTTKSPNPEERAALKMGIDLAQKSQADIVLATDPDADRMGLGVMHEGEIHLLTGNQTACLLLDHVCRNLSEKGILPARGAFVKTIVTTELFRTIAESYDRPCFDTLTGFKYIGQIIHIWEQDPEGWKYIFGGEESYGYLLGTHARDKDAVICCAIAAELALHCKIEGKTLVDRLHELYQKHGVYREKLHSLSFPPTKEGMEKIQVLMGRFRLFPPEELAGSRVTIIEDYQSGKKTLLTENRQDKLHLPPSNVLRLFCEDGSSLVLRPSGTEPKMKIYASAREADPKSVPEAIERCDQKLDAQIQDILNLGNN